MVKSKKIKKEVLNFNAVFQEEKDGGYSVSIPTLPGCYSEGDTFEAAIRNIHEAIELYLEDIDVRTLRSAGTQREFVVPVSVMG